MLQRTLLDGDAGRPSSWPSDSLPNSPPSPSSSYLSSVCSPRPSPVSYRTVTLLSLLLGLSLLTLCILAAVVASLHSSSSPPSPSLSPSSTGTSLPSDPALSFALHLQLPHLMPHIHAFQLIANSSAGSRVISGPGFNRSVDYVLSQLSSTSLLVRREFFTVERWQLLTAALSSQGPAGRVDWQLGQDFIAVTNSGRDGLTFDNSSLILIPHSGCDESDWSSAVAGRTALVQRGTGPECTLYRQSQLAVLYQAAGLVVYNAASNISIQTTATVAPYTAIPVFLVTWGRRGGTAGGQ